MLVFLVLWFLRKKFKHDGDALLCYAGLYGFERMFVEGLRGDSLWLVQPNTVSWLSGGIRVSQLLSLVLVIAVLVFVLVRRSREKTLGRLIWPAPEQEPEEEPEQEVDAACAAEEEQAADAESTEKPEEGNLEEEKPEEPELQNNKE